MSKATRIPKAEQMRIRIDTIEELYRLPHQAVVYDRSNRVWQKCAIRRQVGWATPGIAGTFAADEIELPAWLLDDER